MSFAMVAAAGVGAGVLGLAGLGSALISSDAATKAAQTQAASYTEGQKAITERYDAMQKLLQPYVDAGNQSLQRQQALTGMLGPEAQQQAIQGLSEGPEMQAFMQQGENALLANASATGGLRGGNLQGALAQFRPQLLSGLINQQYQRLGGITQMGQASAAGVGAGGMQAGANIADLMGLSGAATAGGQLASGQAFAQVPQNVVQGGLLGYGMYNQRGI